MSKKCIVILASYAPSLINFRGPLIKTLSELGHQVIAIAPGKHTDVEVQLAKWGVQYQSITLDRTGINISRDISDIVKLTRLLRKLRADVILSYTIKPVIYGSIAAYLAKIPRKYALITGLGYSFQGTSIKRRFFSFIVRAMYKTALSNINAVIFQNNDDKELFLNKKLTSKNKVFTVNGSGVDLDHYTPSPPPDSPIFLLIARLIYDKGILEYVKAAKILKARHPQARFQLAGPLDINPSAITNQELDSWIEQGVIEYLGVLKDVRPILSSCSVYVLPSYREGTPRTVLEAMAQGRAIVTTNAPGCKETVTDNVNGFKVPIKNVDDLVYALEQLITNPDTRVRMGKASLKIAEEKYDVRKVNFQMLKIMELNTDSYDKY